MMGNIPEWPVAVGQLSRADAGCRYANTGFALLEVAVSILLFGLAMLGVMSAQTVGARASYDALQRTVALAMAQDLLARVRANPGSLRDYSLRFPTQWGSALPLSLPDCYATTCSPGELAIFDLHQWQDGVEGHWEVAADAPIGSLVSPGACVGGGEGIFEVLLSWVALTSSGYVEPPSCSFAAQQNAVPDTAQSRRVFLRFRVVLETPE